MALLNKFLLLLFSVSFVSVYSYEYIPVYMWETSKNYSPLPALGRLNEEFFRDILLDKFNKEKVVLVFLEENLSPEDFTAYDSAGNSVFYSLSHIKSEAQVNYYPFVEAPLKALQNLPGVKVSKVDVTSEGLPAGTKVQPGEVLIIDLNDAKENEDRSHMLSRHDSLVASIYKSISSENENVIALFTARHSSWLVPSELEGSGNVRKARHLLADEEKVEAFLVNETDILLYASAPFVLNFTDSKGVIIKRADFTDVKNSIDNNTLSLEMTGSGTVKSLTLQFEEKLGYWYFRNIAGKFTKDGNEEEFEFKLRNVYAPRGFSYHCNNTEYYSANDTYTFAMPGLQVQAFKSNASFSFGDAYDCVGFTTAPIWSGLFVTFILAMIMTFGLCMIMDIKTMDRFDDPKGKTISINVVE